MPPKRLHPLTAEEIAARKVRKSEAQRRRIARIQEQPSLAQILSGAKRQRLEMKNLKELQHEHHPEAESPGTAYHHFRGHLRGNLQSQKTASLESFNGLTNANSYLTEDYSMLSEKKLKVLHRVHQAIACCAEVIQNVIRDEDKLQAGTKCKLQQKSDHLKRAAASLEEYIRLDNIQTKDATCARKEVDKSVTCRESTIGSSKINATVAAMAYKDVNLADDVFSNHKKNYNVIISPFDKLQNITSSDETGKSFNLHGVSNPNLCNNELALSALDLKNDVSPNYVIANNDDSLKGAVSQLSSKPYTNLFRLLSGLQCCHLSNCKLMFHNVPSAQSTSFITSALPTQMQRLSQDHSAMG